jgi:8-oxo-dGTP diphosphatase
MIIELPGDTRPQIVLVKRKNPPLGWALPGGFVDYGETVEQAAVREALEETGLAIDLKRQFHTYSDPARDERGHMISVVFIAEAEGTPEGGDDASLARAFSPDRLPDDIAFDHRQIIQDYLTANY